MGVDSTMKMFRVIPALLLFTLPCVGEEKDVWYGASGEVVGMTPVEKERETFVPDWKKRENARLEAQRTGNYQRTQRSWGSRYYGSSFYRTSFRGFRSFRGSSFRRASFRGFRGSSFRGGSFRGRSGGRSSLRVRF